MSKMRLKSKAFTCYFLTAGAIVFLFNLTGLPEIREKFTTPEYRTYTEQVANYPHPSVIVELQKRRAFEEVVAGRASPETLSDPNLRAIATELRDIGRHSVSRNVPLWAVASETAAHYVTNRFHSTKFDVRPWVECIGPEYQKCVFTGELEVLNDPARLDRLWGSTGPELNAALTAVPADPHMPTDATKYTISDASMTLLQWSVFSLVFAVAYFGFGMAMNRLGAKRDGEANEWGDPLTSALPSWYSYLMITLILPGYLLIKTLYRIGVALNDLLTRLHTRLTRPKDLIAKLQLDLENALEYEAVRNRPELQERLRVAISNLQSERQKPSAKAVHALIEEAEMQTSALREAEDELADFDESLSRSTEKQ